MDAAAEAPGQWAGFEQDEWRKSGLRSMLRGKGGVRKTLDVMTTQRTGKPHQYIPLAVLLLLGSELGLLDVLQTECDNSALFALLLEPTLTAVDIWLVPGVCTGDRIVNQDHWLVSACAAAGASSDVALTKGGLQNLDPTAVIAIRLEKRRSKSVIAPTSGMGLGSSIYKSS